MNGEMNRYVKMVEDHLAKVCDVVLPVKMTMPDGSLRECRVNQAARYSLLSGGKRIRGVLVLSTCEMLGGKAEDALDLAAAVEMVHCYSLIHDDLPCMDNDDFRRGKPSCHKAFDEETALLAGDALQAAAFTCLSSARKADGEPLAPKAVVSAVSALSLGCGPCGMVLGQELDLAFENRPMSEDILKCIHHYKTGQLINAAMQMGVAAANGTEADHEHIARFAFDLGLVFQIVDDVLDETSTAEELGKPIGSDAENGKTTYVTLLGVEGAMKQARQLTQRSNTRLMERYGEKSSFLVGLANALLARRS